jgi:hypothetical protein
MFTVVPSESGAPMSLLPHARISHMASERAGLPAAGAVRCGGCSATFPAAEWRALPLVHVLTDEAIATHVRAWPKGDRIEIRRCSRCGRHVARRA